MQRMKIKVTSVAFSKNIQLVKKAKSLFSDIQFNERGVRFSKTELIAFLKDADAAIIGLDNINGEVLKQLPKLKYISKYGVQSNSILLNSLQCCLKYLTP